jgi:hypothetical protein
LEQRLKSFDEGLKRLSEAKAELKSFAAKGAESEQQERALVQSAPGVGEAVCEVVLAELANADRFGSIKQVTAYAGLVPGKRESDGKSKDLGITKKGSRLLRWAMVQAAWQAVRTSARWRLVYEQLKRRRGSKRAIVAVARRLLGVLASMLKSGEKYRCSLAELKDREARAETRKRKGRLAREAKAKAEPAPMAATKAQETKKAKKAQEIEKTKKAVVV